jgi:hypothetical protein
MSQGWMSVSDIAGALGVSKQAVSKQLSRFGDRVPTRREGIRLMVDAAAYERVSGAETDPAQALRNRDVNANAAQAALPLQSDIPKLGDAPKRSTSTVAGEAFSVHRAKREKYDADLSRLAYEREIGKVVPVDQVTDALVICAQKMVRIIDALPSESEDPVVRAILKRKAFELRTALYESMKVTAESAEDDADEATS